MMFIHISLSICMHFIINLFDRQRRKINTGHQLMQTGKQKRKVRGETKTITNGVQM